MKFIATRGLPASGKSTWAKEQVVAAGPGNAVRINRDLFRTMLHYDVWSKDAERITVACQKAAIKACVAERIPLIICDDTNLDPLVMMKLQGLFHGMPGWEFEIKDFTHVPLDTCIARDALRTGTAQVGPNVIIGMHKRYLVDNNK
jgi:predicted kinase